jgi:hypothetical protein
MYSAVGAKPKLGPTPARLCADSAPKALISDACVFAGTDPKDSIGLISSVHDSVISMFFSFGQLGGLACPSPLPLPYDKIHGGLTRLAAQGIPLYMIPGGEHTHTGSKASFYSQSVESVHLYDWVSQLIDPTRPDPPTVQPKGAAGEGGDAEGSELEAGELEGVEAGGHRLTWMEYVSAKRQGLTPWAPL